MRLPLSWLRRWPALRNTHKITVNNLHPCGKPAILTVSINSFSSFTSVLASSKASCLSSFAATRCLIFSCSLLIIASGEQSIIAVLNMWGVSTDKVKTKVVQNKRFWPFTQITCLQGVAPPCFLYILQYLEQLPPEHSWISRLKKGKVGTRRERKTWGNKRKLERSVWRNWQKILDLKSKVNMY